MVRIMKKSGNRLEGIGERIDVRLTLLEEALGMTPGDPEIYGNWIASKAPEPEVGAEEVGVIEGMDAVEDATTCFPRTEDGVLTSASSGALQIVNGSNFGIHVSGVSVAKQSPFNIVADASKATEDNAVDFQFGVDSALIDAAAPKAKAGSYDLAPTGAAGATLNLKAQGDAKNVKEDIAKDKTVATITWTFAAGNAAGGISVDDSWEGNHEMGID